MNLRSILNEAWSEEARQAAIEARKSARSGSADGATSTTGASGGKAPKSLDNSEIGQVKSLLSGLTSQSILSRGNVQAQTTSAYLTSTEASVEEVATGFSNSAKSIEAAGFKKEGDLQQGKYGKSQVFVKGNTALTLRTYEPEGDGNRRFVEASATTRKNPIPSKEGQADDWGKVSRLHDEHVNKVGRALEVGASVDVPDHPIQDLKITKNSKSKFTATGTVDGKTLNSKDFYADIKEDSYFSGPLFDSSPAAAARSLAILMKKQQGKKA